MALEVLQPEHLNHLAGNGFDKVYSFLQRSKHTSLFAEYDKVADNVFTLFEGEDSRGIRRIDTDLMFHNIAPVLSEGGIIVVRHGAQFAPGLSKIAMMQMPHNYQDPLTHISMAEAAAFAVFADQLQKSTGLPVEIWTSKNIRAYQVAQELSIFTRKEGSIPNLYYKTALDCLNYPNKPEEEINEMLGPDAKGSLLWERLDDFAGEGTRQMFKDNMMGLIRLAFRISPEGEWKNKIIIMVTHTQQTNAVDALFGDENPERYSELGFCVITGDDFKEDGSFHNKYYLHENGIFLPK